MLYPFIFHPIFKERIWGGRELERLYHKPIPAGKRIGESWEICDRTDDNNVIANGPLAGRTLHWLLQNHAEQLLGPGTARPSRFPLLIKILDARDKLSLQVHPPAAIAAQLGGEPKTEMWYVAHAGPGATLYAGLKRGVTRAEFERRVADHTVAEAFHRLPVKAGDSLFLPSGRVHAIGSDLVIFEVQQNSDTTYRVFDWDRKDDSGKPRQLHLAESLASIDFKDFEPALSSQSSVQDHWGEARSLVKDPLFEVASRKMEPGMKRPFGDGRLVILAVIAGRVEVTGSDLTENLGPGHFCMIPAAVRNGAAHAVGAATLLEIRLGTPG